MDVVRVQRWVMSALLLTTMALFASGLALMSLYVENRGGSRVGLMVIAGVVGVGAMVGVRLLNQKSWLTPWLTLGLAPALGAAYVAFWA
ncbi:MAG: hypothetical protein ACRDPJ_20520 [Nocardioidaceae bacterium]